MTVSNLSKRIFIVLEELADVERLKRIFRGYFADHQSFVAIKHDELQSIVEERAQACAAKYREKLRRLHLSHTDYYSDTVQRFSEEDNSMPENLCRSRTFICNNVDFNTNLIYPNSDELDERISPISVV